jgi:hypothetical protein
MFGFSLCLTFGWNGIGWGVWEIRLPFLTIGLSRGHMPARLAAVQKSLADALAMLRRK